MLSSTITTKTVIYKGRYPVYIILKEGKEKGFLMPFRKYSFQVCRNMDGECDMGTSEIDPRMQDPIFIKNVGESYVRGLINQCLVNYCNTSYGRKVIENMDDFFQLTEEMYKNELNKFINASYKYLTGDFNSSSGIPEYVEEKEKIK